MLGRRRAGWPPRQTMTDVTIDLTGKRTKTDLHRQIAEALHFPPYYGYNLDALSDCLTDIRSDTRIYIYGAERFFDKRYIKRMKIVFYDAAHENRHLNVKFVNSSPSDDTDYTKYED